MKYIMIKLIYIYILIAVSVIIHEIAHYIVAKIVGAKNIFVEIGYKSSIKMRVRNVTISPLIIGGAVDCIFPEDTKAIGIIIFYLSGGLINLLIAIVTFCFKSMDMAMINTVLVIISWLPIKRLNNDMVILLDNI